MYTFVYKRAALYEGVNKEPHVSLVNMFLPDYGPYRAETYSRR